LFTKPEYEGGWPKRIAETENRSVPQGLKPVSLAVLNGSAEAEPFQTRILWDDF
jgi:hypothetical protein